jgi:hypothetical protein
VDRDLDLQFRLANGDWDRWPAVIEEVIQLKPDIIWAGATLEAVWVRKATSTIPIVCSALANAVRLGLRASEENPLALAKQRLQIFKLALCHGRGLMVWRSGGKGRTELLASALEIPKPVYRLSGGGSRAFQAPHATCSASLAAQARWCSSIRPQTDRQLSSGVDERADLAFGPCVS